MKLKRSYGDGAARAPHSNQGEVVHGGRLDGTVGHPVSVVLLLLSQPHQEVRIQGLGGWVKVLPTARASRRRVLRELGVDVRVWCTCRAHLSGCTRCPALSPCPCVTGRTPCTRCTAGHHATVTARKIQR